jgi:hypothetical protein
MHMPRKNPDPPFCHHYPYQYRCVVHSVSHAFI